MSDLFVDGVDDDGERYASVEPVRDVSPVEGLVWVRNTRGSGDSLTRSLQVEACGVFTDDTRDGDLVTTFVRCAGPDVAAIVFAVSSLYPSCWWRVEW